MDWQFVGRMLQGAFWNSHNWVLAIPTYLGVITLLLPFLLPHWQTWSKKVTASEKSRGRIRAMAIVAFVVLLFVSLILSANSLYENKTVQLATPDALLSDNLTGLKIRLADLAVGNPLVSNKVFKDCLLYGPGVMSIHNNCTGRVIAQLHDDITIDSVLIATTNERWAGVVIFDNCVFNNCRIRDIAIIGSPEVVAQLKAELQSELKSD